MKESARYVKIVEWSEEDHCYVGSAPGLIYGGCHGDDEKAVFAELCQIVEESINTYKIDNKPSLQRHRVMILQTSCNRSRNKLHLFAHSVERRLHRRVAVNV
jgi:hypothetical protein